MNPFLAEMYNTRETIGAPAQSDDVEKLAEAQLLDEALRAENIDVDTLSPDQIIKVASTLFGEDSALVKAATSEAAAQPAVDPAIEAAAAQKLAAQAAPAPEAAAPTGETAEEKLAEADFLGRVMAHSFTQERAEIEKQGSFGQAVKNWGQLAGHGAHMAGEAASHGAHSASEAAKRFGGKAHEFGKKGLEAGKKGYEAAKSHPKTTAGIAAGAAAAAGGGAAFAMHHKKKHGSALDKLAEERAMQILQENGVGQTDDEKLATAVEQRAWEMLNEQGYTQQDPQQ